MTHFDHYLRPCSWIEFLHYVSKHSKLAQLIIQVQYRVNVIYSLGVDTQTHIRGYLQKVTLRSQAHATWLKNELQQLLEHSNRQLHVLVNPNYIIIIILHLMIH